jgi:hypothetical protein
MFDEETIDDETEKETEEDHANFVHDSDQSERMLKSYEFI